MKFPTRGPLGALLLVGGVLTIGCAPALAQVASAAQATVRNGPAADYPVVIGDPFDIDGTTYTPIDTMNYDEVGYLAAEESGDGVTASSKTLPLPSYVEVTALETGRTILVRVERRGPMSNTRVLGLAPRALAQLGVGEGAPIRVRRVNPPEDHRADLRAGVEAPLRMDTPAGLLEVLKRRLPATGSAPLGDPRQAQVSGKIPNSGEVSATEPVEIEDDQNGASDTVAPADVASSSEPLREHIEPDEEPEPAPVNAPIAEVSSGKFVVQLGAFAVRENADTLARKVEGSVVQSGHLALVRVGPFETRGQAQQALAKLNERGYRDTLIVSLD